MKCEAWLNRCGQLLLALAFSAGCVGVSQPPLTPSSTAVDSDWLGYNETAMPGEQTETPLGRMPEAIRSPIITYVPEIPRPTATPGCVDDLRLQVDLTMPGGSVVSPGQSIDKRWQVENSGTCNWDERYSLRLVAGPELGATHTQALYPARGGTQAVIRILFTAPDELGTYRSAWQAYDPQGNTFGDLIFLEIVVAGPGP